MRRSTTLAALRGIVIVGLLLTVTQVAMAKTIVVYGDSLSAAFGINPKQGWVELLARDLEPNHILINASISGETSAGGLARLAVTLDELAPDVVLLELGANDGLRGGSTVLLKQNLQAMIELIQNRGITVVLIGISMPPSYGPRYIDSFRSVYRDLATALELPFLDFYREEFFIREGYIQADGLHPTEIAQPTVKELVRNFLLTEGLIDAPQSEQQSIRLYNITP